MVMVIAVRYSVQSVGWLFFCAFAGEGLKRPFTRRAARPRYSLPLRNRRCSNNQVPDAASTEPKIENQPQDCFCALIL